ncbi:MAG: MerR family transcriptional regulator [Bacteroidetes bacterium]|nr:MerR family transcriptional regulator [Bacteroidota bacterium]
MPAFYQIGEVAERTGLTHRALHYYDEIGLLVPNVKLDGGLRLYTEEDLRRLDRILEIRKLFGLSLKEIKKMLQAEDTRTALLDEARKEPTPEMQRADFEKALAIALEQLSQIRGRIHQMQLLEERLTIEVAELRTALDQTYWHREEAPNAGNS